MSEQEKIGKAIADLKKLYPDLSACERADLVLTNPFVANAVSVNGNSGGS